MEKGIFRQIDEISLNFFLTKLKYFISVHICYPHKNSGISADFQLVHEFFHIIHRIIVNFLRQPVSAKRTFVLWII